MQRRSFFVLYVSVSIFVLSSLPGCSDDGGVGGMGSTSGGMTGGTARDEASGSATTGPGGAADTDFGTGADVVSCEPVTELSCAEIGAQAVRGLVDDEFLGASVRDPDGPRDFVFSNSAVTRTPPRPEHPGYVLSLSELWEGDIQAPLAESTRNELMEVAADVPPEPGSYTTGFPEMTLRIGDRQVCFDPETSCSALDAVYHRLLELDELIVSRWDEQTRGSLYAFEEIQIHDWPLTLQLSADETFEVSESDSDTLDALEGGWFVDAAGNHAHVQQSCTGSDSECGPPGPGDDWDLCCDTWYVEISPARLESSPLGAEEHAALLARLDQFLYPPLTLEGDAFTAVRDAHILSFPDPETPETLHHVTVLARPNLYLETPL